MSEGTWVAGSYKLVISDTHGLKGSGVYSTPSPFPYQFEFKLHNHSMEILKHSTEDPLSWDFFIDCRGDVLQWGGPEMRRVSS